MLQVEVEFPDEDAVFIMELLERLPGVTILPPRTEAEAAERQHVAEHRAKLYGSYNPLSSAKQ